MLYGVFRCLIFAYQFCVWIKKIPPQENMKQGIGVKFLTTNIESYTRVSDSLSFISIFSWKIYCHFYVVLI